MTLTKFSGTIEFDLRETEEREYAPFAKIRDSYPRILLTLDPLLQRRDGVRHLNLLDVFAGAVPLLP